MKSIAANRAVMAQVLEKFLRGYDFGQGRLPVFRHATALQNMGMFRIGDCEFLSAAWARPARPAPKPTGRPAPHTIIFSTHSVI